MKIDFQKSEQHECVSVILIFNDGVEHKHRFLSNFWPCNVSLPAEDITLSDGNILSLPKMDFESTEHAYMAWKTIDLKERDKIASFTAEKAKEYTHKEDFILRPDYSDEGRIDTMRTVVEQKFSKRNPELRQMLLETKEASIIEGNIWGDDFFGLDLTTGQGANHLGQILMYVRDRIRQEEGFVPVSDETKSDL